MPVGFNGRRVPAPGFCVRASMGTSVWFPKLPTSTSPPATAIVCGPGPTGMAVPACSVATSIGVTVLLP